MKLKIRFPGMLLPSRKQNRQINSQTGSPTEKSQTPFIIALLVLWLIIFLFSICRCNAQDLQSLKVGDSVPDVTIDHIVNSKTSTVKLSDFRGKLLILDFWATYCVPCLKLLPHYDSLQQKFGGDLQILMVTRESYVKVNAFFNRHHCSLPSVTSDELLTHLFRHTSIPHEVWIKDGKVLATTFGDDVNELTIRNALNNQDIIMEFKADNLAWDSNLPLLVNGNGGNGRVSYLSLITPYLAGVRTLSGFDKNNERISSIYTNTSVVALYHQAFSHLDPLLNFDNRLILRVPDSLKRKLDRPNNVNPTDWMKSNCFCYNLVLPSNYKGNVGDLMIKDLNNFFNARFNISAHLEKMTVDCLVLSKSESGRDLSSAGGTPVLESDDHHFKMIGHRIEDLVSFLAESFSNHPEPFIDDTGYKGLIDIELGTGINDLPAVQNELLKYGLSLTVQKRTIEMIIITHGEPLINQPSTFNY